ncbi:MAG: DUF2062 domain-containing protein [Candidatus Omnitrophica bacterium]|nr:DUF2062 domain-containing protein [Candidatus Omnitrophota bacterium]
MRKKTADKIRIFFKFIYRKLFRINDSPQKIALGFGIGAFSGITPGIGPLTALALAFILRANRAAAVIGTILTNTWLSFVTFILSIKIGSAILGVSWQEAYNSWAALLKDFRLERLFDASVINLILPVVIGYLTIGAAFGMLTYAVTLSALSLRKRRKTHED